MPSDTEAWTLLRIILRGCGGGGDELLLFLRWNMKVANSRHPEVLEVTGVREGVVESLPGVRVVGVLLEERFEFAASLPPVTDADFPMSAGFGPRGDE